MHERAPVEGGQHADPLLPEYLAVIRLLATRLGDPTVVWALTGSASFALQGLPATPQDIDLQTDRQGAFEVEKRFPEAVVRPVVFSATGKIRSYFGALQVQGISVDIIGDIQKRLPDGTWTPIPDIRALRRYVRVEGLAIPVLDLAYEAEAYALMGRPARAEEIRRWLETGTTKDPG